MTMVQSYETEPVLCRRPPVPACDPASITGAVPAAINATPILVRKGDTIDVGIDWSAWLEANKGKLKSVAWAAHGSTPQAPTISGATTLFSKGEAVVLLNLGSAVVDNIYWLTCTATIEGIPDGAFTMPDRIVARTITVKVVA